MWEKATRLVKEGWKYTSLEDEELAESLGLLSALPKSGYP